MIKTMKHRFLFIMALLLTAATGAWAQDPDPIDLTPSANGTVWTLTSMPEYNVELELEYYDYPAATLTSAPTSTTITGCWSCVDSQRR